MPVPIQAQTPDTAAALERDGWRTPDLARDIDAGAYLETMLVAAVTSVLLTRLYLQAAGYPQIGGSGLHLAHLLWGGLLMLVALILLLATLGKRLKHVAATIGGLGFGLFVDEIGKFVTSDNDYFFQPAIAIIYLIMVVLFLLFRAIDRRTPTPLELLVNAADHVREVVLDGATTSEVARGLDLLARSGARGPVVEHIRALLESTEYEPDSGPTTHLRRTAEHVWRLYDRLVAWRWFQRGVLLVFVGQALLGLVAALVVAALGAMALPSTVETMLRPDQSALDAMLGEMSAANSIAVGSVATSVLSLFLVAIGVIHLPRRRITAYRWFERSLLVAILVTQVMLFWQDQFAALGGLFWNLMLLTVVRSMIALEAARGAVQSRATSQAAAAS